MPETLEQLHDRYDELSAGYRELKAERTALLSRAKREADGTWPKETQAAARSAGVSVTDHAAGGLDEADAARLAEIDAELARISDARRLLRKPSRQRAADERAANVAAAVAKMTPEEKAALQAALGRND